MNMIRKEPIKGSEKGDIMGQVSFINEIFGVAAPSGGDEGVMLSVATSCHRFRKTSTVYTFRVKRTLNNQYMKVIPKILISITTGVTFSLLSAMSSYGDTNYPSTVKIPEDSEKGCEEAINLVKEELTERGFFIPYSHNFGGRTFSYEPRMLIAADYIENAYLNYPESRPHSVRFSLSGEWSNLDNLMASPQLMANYGSRIMADCYQVGLVSFIHWEHEVPVGYFPDNTARTFRYVDTDLRPSRGSLQWGNYTTH